MNADPLEKSQRFAETLDMFVSPPYCANHNYVRFEADKLLFCCDLLSAAIFDLGRLDLAHRRTLYGPADKFVSESPSFLQEIKTGKQVLCIRISVCD
jgi:hypothetical protein